MLTIYTTNCNTVSAHKGHARGKQNDVLIMDFSKAFFQIPNNNRFHNFKLEKSSTSKEGCSAVHVVLLSSQSHCYWSTDLVFKQRTSKFTLNLAFITLSTSANYRKYVYAFFPGTIRYWNCLPPTIIVHSPKV